MEPGARLAEGDAVRLLIERAREADPELQPAAADLQAAAQICKALDGLPLAIELAAARTRVLSLNDIAARLVGPDPRLGPDLPAAFNSSRVAAGAPHPASRRCAPPSTGATSC